MLSSKIILGIDHGLHHMGWAVIEDTGNEKPKYLDGDVFHSSGKKIPVKSVYSVDQNHEDVHCTKLSQIYQKIDKILKQYRPHVVVFEDMLLNKNPKTSLILAMARGSVLSAVGVYKENYVIHQDLIVRSYKPNIVKHRVSGYGHAEKRSIADMLGMYFDPMDAINTIVSTDATDALAIALCYFFEKKLIFCS
jgi:crossover junction endodeoxyribonuclease RuvC